jgi:amino acid adenylation domain-containing protein
VDLTSVPPQARDRLAARLARARHAKPQDIFPGTDMPANWLSSAQRRMWFLDQLSPHSAAYNIPLAWRLHGDLDTTALGDALRDVADRNPVLRTGYAAENGQPVPVLRPAADLRLRRGTGRQGWLDAESARPFALDAGLPIRAAIAQTGPQTHELAVVVHHIAADGWSIGLIADELSAAYAARIAGRCLPAPTAIPYPQAARRQELALDGDRLARGIAYWRERMAGAPPALRLPAEWQRPPEPGPGGRIWSTDLPPELSEHVRRTAAAERATPFMVLLAGFAAACSRWTAAEDIVLGTAVAGRDAPELARVIGCFVNSLPVRLRVPARDPGLELIRRVRETLLHDLEHADVPFERLVDEARAGRQAPGAPLFEIMAVAGNVPRRGLDLAGVEAVQLPADPGAAKLDLSLSVDDVAGHTELAFTYRTELFSEASIARLARQYLTLLASLLRNPERPVGELAMLADDEARAVVTGSRPRQAGTVLGLFDAQVRARPDAPAVTDGVACLTYRQLDARARAISAELTGAGVTPGAVVGLLAERAASSVAGILGILRTGAAYAPVDADAPDARVKDLLGAAGTAAVVGPPRLRMLAGQTPFVPWDIAAHPAAEPAGARPGDLAYVMFTSGSTGRPKGVEVEHLQLHRYVTAILDLLGATPGERFALVSTLAADLGHTSVFGALCSGGVLHVCDREQAADATVLAPAFRAAPPDHLKLTPSHLAALLDAAGPDQRDLLPRRTLVIGGEALGWPLVDRVRELAPALRILNHYGPTETTVGALVWDVTGTGPRQANPPIGAPLEHSCASVRDAAGAPVPAGVPGELYIGGAAVARGYRRDPELTAARFVADRYGQGRLYRTGDRARLRTDGSYEFLGRVDDQVKIRGYRVEPGEVVAALRVAPGVTDAAVVAQPDGDEHRLVGYVVGVADTGPVRAWLRQRLPEHLVPRALVPLPALPLTPNGKLDRSALPPPATAAPVIPVTRAPRSETERALAGIWEDLLATGVSVDDDFFALGGHSLLAARMAARIRAELDVEVPLRRLFELRTLDSLARHVDTLRWAAAQDGAAIEASAIEAGAAIEDGAL